MSWVRAGVGRVAVGVLAASLISLGAVHARPASADTAPAPGTPGTVTADSLPTVQINGVAWKTVIVGNTVFAGGSFSSARPAGSPKGTGEVPRSNLLAFDLTTGDLLPFNPVVNAQIVAMTASADGRTLYVGGDFTTVNGQVRSKIAAFDVATGQLTGFAPTVGSQVRAIALSGSTVYVGGIFGTAGGKNRTRLAAFRSNDGGLLPWAPVADQQVETMVVSADGTRVLVGGRFQTINTEAHVGIAAVNPVTGATLPWSSRPVPTAISKNQRSWVTDLYIKDGVVYAADDGEGGHWFDGRWAAEVATGNLIWLDNCYGATYGIYATGQTVYSVSHAHDCSSLGEFPQSSTWHRALAETTYPVGTDKAPKGSNSNYSKQPIPQLLHWFPTLSPGSYTRQNQAAWAVRGNGTYVVMGGEFTTVNGQPQQGLVRMADPSIAPKQVRPVYSESMRPVATSTQPGTVSVTWPATYDQDNSLLRYDIYRDYDKTPAYSLDQAATGWTKTAPTWPTGPAMSFTDTDQAWGSSHTYKLVVSDPDGNNFAIRSPAVTVAADPDGRPPTAALSVSCTALECTADAAASSDLDSDITGYTVDFGDGSPAVTGTEPVQQHTYVAAGSYPVTVTVTDSKGHTATATGTATAQDAPAPPDPNVLAADSFTRTVAAGGWGHADLGGAWTLGRAQSFSVDGSAGLVALTPSAGPSATLGEVSATTSTVSVSLSTDAPATGGGVYLSTMARKVTGGGDYRGKLRLLSSGAVSASLARVGADYSEVALGTAVTVPDLSLAPGTLLRVKVQAAGTSPTTLSMKVWVDGTPEPADWLLTATDSTESLQVAGSVGLLAYLSGSASTPVTVRYDDLRVTVS